MLPSRAPHAAGDAGPDAEVLSVLLVEDNAINQEIALAMLEETRYRRELTQKFGRANGRVHALELSLAQANAKLEANQSIGGELRSYL
jgi:CheY-like chemotaxis protein